MLCSSDWLSDNCPGFSCTLLFNIKKLDLPEASKAFRHCLCSNWCCFLIYSGYSLHRGSLGIWACFSNTPLHNENGTWRTLLYRGWKDEKEGDGSVISSKPILFLTSWLCCWHAKTSKFLKLLGPPNSDTVSHLDQHVLMNLISGWPRTSPRRRHRRAPPLKSHWIKSKSRIWWFDSYM